MVSPAAMAGLVVLVAIHTVLAGIATRFVRLYADTSVGVLTGIAIAIPGLLFASTLVLSGAFRLGIDLGDPALAALVAIGLPAGLGATIDYLWVASPEEVDRALAN